MVEGFWVFQYEGMQGNGSGVVVFMRGQILGGDSAFIYTGAYKTDERTISARILIRSFLPEVPNFLGGHDDLELSLNGTVEGRVVKASASWVRQEGTGIVVKLTRVCDLPL